MVVQIQTEDEAPHLVALAKGKTSFGRPLHLLPKLTSRPSSLVTRQQNRSILAPLQRLPGQAGDRGGGLELPGQVEGTFNLARSIT